MVLTSVARVGCCKKLVWSCVSRQLSYWYSNFCYERLVLTCKLCLKNTFVCQIISLVESVGFVTSLSFVFCLFFNCVISKLGHHYSFQFILSITMPYCLFSFFSSFCWRFDLICYAGILNFLFFWMAFILPLAAGIWGNAGQQLLATFWCGFIPLNLWVSSLRAIFVFILYGIKIFNRFKRFPVGKPI